ncbi:MAG: thioredoxin-disulfide reductase [candidate division Zixibacteria bacterium]|nr:thioredoxin-disulfide reductase [candidate division Zixibacteria bacterium]
MAEDKIYDLIIIGGGPAGLTAGIYATRGKLDTLLLEKLTPGGTAATTDWVENYPGFPEGITGADLMKKMEEQAKRFGLKITSTKEVISVDFTNKIKTIKVDEGEYKTKAVIIATGTEPKKLNIPGEDKFRGRGVSYCATCDGPFFKDKNIVVIGAGNSGIQEGLYLLRFVKSATVVEFLPHMTAEKILQERALKEPKMKFHLNHIVTSINGENKVESVTIKDRDTGKENKIEVQGVFVYVGLNPMTGFLKGHIELDKWGYILAGDDTKTSAFGVFAAGDVRQKILRQITTASGDGATAAFMAERYEEEFTTGGVSAGGGSA